MCSGGRPPAEQHSARLTCWNFARCWSGFGGRVGLVVRKSNYAAVVNGITPYPAVNPVALASYSSVKSISRHKTWVDSPYIEAYLSLRFLCEPATPKPPRRDPKNEALARDGALNPHPETVRDPLFAANPFFDPKDLVQVRYEMIRRHDAEGMSITDVATSFGVSRPTFYKAQNTLAAAGLAGLVPKPRGPKGGHKVSAEVVAFIANLKTEQPELTTAQCLAAIDAQFGVTVHRRSLERAMTRKKKLQDPVR
jgi:transposase